MNTPNDGGPAFPVHANHVIFNDKVVSAHCPGMSLRDWFAGKALAGLCANPNIHQFNAMCGWTLANCQSSDLAGYAFHLADAMLAARDGKEGA